MRAKLHSRRGITAWRCIHGGRLTSCRVKHDSSDSAAIEPKVFEFKHFIIRHERCAMKIGTDAMVLGSWVQPSASCLRVLDIGTGTGVLAMMMAQRAHPAALIHAIEIEPDAVEQAACNAAGSPWRSMLHVFPVSLQQLCSQHRQQQQHGKSGAHADRGSILVANDHSGGSGLATSHSSTTATFAASNAGSPCQTSSSPGLVTWPQAYDLIVSNPPFFQRSFKASLQQRAVARHADLTLPFPELAAGVAQLLAPTGRFCCILPPSEGSSLVQLMQEQGLQLCRLLHVKGKQEHQQDKRWVMEFRWAAAPGAPSPPVIAAEAPGSHDSTGSWKADAAVAAWQSQHPQQLHEEELVLLESRFIPQQGADKNVYTVQYRQLTHDFHHPKYFQ